MNDSIIIRESLKMGSVVEEIKKINLKWYGHLIREKMYIFKARAEGGRRLENNVFRINSRETNG